MSTTTYISIDVATRSLAVGVYNMKSFKLIDAYRDSDPVVMNNNLNRIIDPVLMNVFDLNEGQKTKDTSIESKAVALKQVLSSVDKEVKGQVECDDIIVLIEYQLSANHTSNAIFNMVVMFYADRYPIKVIPPTWKNTICLHPLLTHSTFLGMCSSNYIANKQHTKYTMLYLLTMIDQKDIIKSIKNKNLDDIADSLCQALAYHKMNC